VGKAKAFTLIELMLVIAVMSILAAFMFPVFAQARARDRQTTCASNLRQLVLAGYLYLQDYDERFPSCYPVAVPPYVMDTPTLLQPYLKNSDVLYCPDRHTMLPYCLDPTDPNGPSARCMGYGYNWGSGLRWGQAFSKGDGLVRPGMSLGGAVFGVALMEVVDPSRCFFFADTNDYWYLTLLREAMPGERKGGEPDATTNDVGRPYEPPRHSGGNNFAFVDGHVRRLPYHGGLWIDGGPWVVPDMSMYSRTGHWEAAPVP
jgi:prepilin-type N-terminal cleavage/methylation domain-containing protein/prepilin-type processing-associated H-X9-DG protein